MKVYFLGTCSGTEPMPARRHASVAIESQGRVYFFDAGEGCSHTAYNLGIDMLAMTKVIISHPHIDHIGGLANLLWVPRKLNSKKKTTPYYGDIDLYTPSLEVWDAVEKILNAGAKERYAKFNTLVHKVSAGLLFDDGILRVTAYENAHIAHEDGICLSYSYLIEAEGKRVVYSGDVKKPAELDEAIGEHCDLLTIETGHHKIDDIYEFTCKKNIDVICFTHHGREILGAEDEAKERVKDLFCGKAHICYDGMTVEL